MSRIIVSTRSARRRIPAATVWDERLWAWEKAARRRNRGRLVAWWMLFAIVAIAALAGVQRLTNRTGAVDRQEEVFWLDEAPPAAASPEPTESVREESTQPVASVAVAPRPFEPVPTSAAPASDPAFGLDDAGPSGDLAVATGTTLERPSEEVVRPVEPPPGPLLVGSVPASTSPVVPRYPPHAEAIGLEADVVALVTTDTAGNVVDFRIERSGGRDFDESVRKAALSTRFRVPLREGRPRAVAFRLPYSFRLE